MTEPIRSSGSLEGLIPHRLRIGGSRKDRRSRRLSAPHSRRRTVQQEHQVPVMMRGMAVGTSTEVHRRSRPRRRFDIALNVPGAEVHLFSLPDLRTGWRLVSGFLMVVIILIFYYAWSSPIFHVQKVDVSGLHRLGIQDLTPIMNLYNELVFKVDPAILKSELESTFPEFSKVIVSVKFPNVVRVKVEERVPILLWLQEGRSILVDPNGFAFMERGHGTPRPSLLVEAQSEPPVVGQGETMDERPAFLPVEMVSGLLSLSAVVPPNTPLIYDSKHGLGWKDNRGWEVFFGDVQDINLKLNVYSAIVKKLKQEDIKATLISVQYVHAPFFRTEK